jgi:hypothetical protein
MRRVLRASFPRGSLSRKVARLRARQAAGDPDMTSEEIQTVIDRVLEERRRLESARPVAKEGAKLAALLPNAADLYRKQISLGLDGDPRAALKARTILRKLCGPIVIESDQDGVELTGARDGLRWCVECRPHGSYAAVRRLRAPAAVHRGAGRLPRVPNVRASSDAVETGGSRR